MAKFISAIEVIGLDLADKKSDLCCIGSEGRVMRRERVRTTEPMLRRVFGEIEPTTVVIEVGTHSAWVSRVLTSLGHEVIVANARKVELIGSNRRKNNRVDGEFLARLGRADRQLLFPIKHRDERSQADLVVLRSRDILVACRTKLINHVRGVLKSFGVGVAKCSTPAFVKRCRGVISPELLLVMEPVLEQIDAITARITVFDRAITKMVVRHPAAKQLMQIVGVGELTALAYVLTIEDPHRIARSRSAGAFLGLVPSSNDSGEDHKPGRITKEGDRFCRRLLVGAAQYILGRFGRDCDLRRHGLAIAGRGGNNAKKRAVVAVARKLAVLMHRLWVTGDVYDPLFNAAASQVAVA